MDLLSFEDSFYKMVGFKIAKVYQFLWYWKLKSAYICNIIGRTPDDAKVFGEIYWEENDI